MLDFSFLKKPSILVSFLFLALYVLTGPHTVQYGDTGELVTNTYFLRVSHPPGYPLWTLLYHLPVRYFNFGNPFRVASVLTSTISFLSILILTLRYNKTIDLLVIGVFASSVVFWKYSLLPDVFALHVLILVITLIVFDSPALLDKLWMIFFISLGIAHHHTFLFVIPLFIFSLSENPKRLNILASVVFGALSLCFYFLLFWFHPHDYGSWGIIDSFEQLVSHFLRKDYGTFTLQNNKTLQQSSWVEFFLKHFFSEAWSIVVLISYLAIKNYKNFLKNKKKVFVFIFSLVSYFVFFIIFGKINLKGDGEVVFEKFLIQPFLVLIFGALIFLKRSSPVLPKWMMIIILINGGVNLNKNFNPNNYSVNISIEDYLVEILEKLPKDSVYFTYGDTIGFGTYYLKDVKEVRTDVIQIHNTWGTDWGPKKFRKKFPALISKEDHVFFDNFNFNSFRFFTNYNPLTVDDGYAIRFFGQVFEISKFNSFDDYQRFDCHIIENPKTMGNLTDFSYFEYGRLFLLRYGDCFHVKAKELIYKKDFELAKSNIKFALENSPNNPIIRRDLCKLYKIINDPELEQCTAHYVEILRTMNHKYYEFLE